MSLKDYKMSDATAQAQGVVSLPDHPSESGMSAASLKAAFDRLARNVVGENLNHVIDALTAQSGAQEIGAIVAGLDGTTVAEILVALAQKAAQAEAHLAEKENPHQVTAAQVGALGEERIATALTDNDSTKIPTVKAVNDGISFAGGGDMMRSTYDTYGMAQDVFVYADAAAERAEENAKDHGNAVKIEANAYTDEALAAAKEYTDEQVQTKAPAYTYGTSDLTAGSSALATGTLYFVYE